MIYNENVQEYDLQSVVIHSVRIFIDYYFYRVKMQIMAIIIQLLLTKVTINGEYSMMPV